MRLLSWLAVTLCVSLGACAEAPRPTLALASAAMPPGVPDVAPASFAMTCNRTPGLCDLADAPSTSGKDDVDQAPTSPKTPPNGLRVAIDIDLDNGASAPKTAELIEAVFSDVYTDPSDHAPAVAPAPPISFDDQAALKLLQTVNGAVNGAMARDMGLLVNAADDWAPAMQTRLGLIGDCKSFAAEKRRRLVAAGFPADRLFYAVVFREDIGLHALLMAHLENGDYALDSRQPWVTRWYDAAYTYIQRQAAGDQMRWTSLTADAAAAAPILLARNTMSATATGAGSR